MYVSKLSFFRQKIFKSKYDQLAPGVVSSHLIELGEFIWIEHKGLALQILYIKAIFSCIKKESQQICFLPKTKALALNCKTAELLRNTVWNSLHNLLFIMPNMVHLCMVCTDFFTLFMNLKSKVPEFDAIQMLSSFNGTYDGVLYS